MKLSENTVSVLKSFAVINQGIEFKEGGVLQTISPQKSIMAKAEIEDVLPAQGCFYELNRFLGVLTLFDDAQLQFNEKFVTVHDSKRSVNYTYADPQMIVTPPAKEIQLPAIDVAVSIKWEDLSNTLKAASVMGLPEIAISSDGSVINLEAISSKNPTADKYSNVIDSNNAGKVFSAIFKIENIKVMNFDYDVELSAKGIAKFKSANDEGPKLTYWIATEGHSTFE
jgi:hypothetical protein|tara:strand:- start:1427 stop:2104 length:678 start_codon:yes stop_codon:yes gene_type:complete